VDLNQHPATEVGFLSPLNQELLVAFDDESHLLSRMKFKQVGPTGEVPIEMILSDYRDVNGFKIAHRHSTRIPPGIELDFEITRIEVGPTIDETKFAEPAGPERVPPPAEAASPRDSQGPSKPVPAPP
jgi:hypothetical protein